MTYITIHPEYNRLLEKLNKLKEQLSVIIEDRDYLLHHKAIYIKTEYINKVGKLEYELFELECKVSRLKRKINMVQAAINLQMPIDEDEIEKQLDKEYKEYIEELRKMSKDIEIANMIKDCDELTLEDVAFIKKLYRKLAKVLHPDLNPGLTEKQKALWMRAQKAYEMSNIDMLKILYELAVEDGGLDTKYSKINTIEELEEKIKFFKEKIKDLLLEIGKTREAFPLNKEKFLKDDEEVYKRQKEIIKNIHERKLILKELEGYLSMIMDDNYGILN